MFPHHKLDWAIKRLQAQVEGAPEDAAVRAELATHLLSKAQFHDGGEVFFNNALTQARHVLQDDPGNLGGLLVAGLSLVGLERLDSAVRHLDEALRLDPENAMVRLGLGLVYQQQSNRHQAIRQLESACRLAPESFEAHGALGQVLWKRAKDLGFTRRIIERSQYHLIQALRLEPSQAMEQDLKFTLALSCLHIGRHRDAEKLFRRLQHHEKYKTKALYYLGITAHQLGRFKHAIVHLRQYLSTDPENPRIHARIGLAHLLLGEIQKAQDACTRALTLDPDNITARWTLGRALVQGKHEEEATRLFKDILEDAPHYTPAYEELVQLRVQLKDSSWLRKALKNEVAVFDRLPTKGNTSKSQASHPTTNPRIATQARISALMDGIQAIDDHPPEQFVNAMDLTTDEALRFMLWNGALEALGSARSKTAIDRLSHAGTEYSVDAVLEMLSVAHLIPIDLLTQGLDITEEDLKRAAVDRHPPTGDVNTHRESIAFERQEARAWQALLLLAIATRNNRDARTLLLRWAAEADPDLAVASQIALAMLGDDDTANLLRDQIHSPSGSLQITKLVQATRSKERLAQPRPVNDDPSLSCASCQRTTAAVGHMLVGANATICAQCLLEIAKQRSEYTTDDPSIQCCLSGATLMETQALYVYQGYGVSSECIDQSLGLLERETLEAYFSGGP